MGDTIKELSRVAINVSSENDAKQMQEVSFIYGLATEGLTLFEGALADKKVGDTISVDVNQPTAAAYFGGVWAQVRPLFAGGAPMQRLKVVVTDVTLADNRDVVKALAGQIGGCGSGDCGCGCS